MTDFEGSNGRVHPEENEDAIAEVFLDALALPDKLKELGVKPDCLIGRQIQVRKSIFRRKESVTEFVDGWDLHGCEPAGIRSLALSTDGILYLNSTEPMSGGDDQVTVMPQGIELHHDHFETFARADELSDRLHALSAAHA